MKRLFNKPWVIVLLACFASYMVYTNAIAPYIQTTSSINSDVPEFITNEESTTTFEDVPSSIQKRVSINSLFWNESPKRDPFRPIPKTNQIALDSVAKIRKKTDAQMLKKKFVKLIKPRSKKSKPLKPDPLPILTGFVSGYSSRRAIVNEKIVTEGQIIGRFKIVTIQKNGVLVINRGKGTEHFLAVPQ